MDDSAVSIKGVYKDFNLPNEKTNSLKSHIVHPLSRREFQKQHALKDISVEIKKGEFFGIVGRNGSGKSTLLKIIAGIYQPSKGGVKVNGKLVPFIELGVGFNPELSGRDNVYLNGALLGFSKKAIDEMYNDIVEFAELEEHMDQKLKNYSSGMQVRLAFSVAVRAKADILLIDEVLAVGDADFQRKCFDYFKQLKKENTTVIFVSHNMDAVREYCDRAMLIEKSQIVEIGVTNKIAENYLRLFAADAYGGNQTKRLKENRWGEQSVKLTDINVEVGGQTIKMTQHVKALANIENPIVGFRIRDAAGKDVTGTNTLLEQKSLGQLVQGEKKVLVWEFPNFLSDGTYFVDPAIVHADGITIADWWNEAAKFQVKKTRHTPYTVDPGFELEIK